MPDVPMELWELVARESIRDLVARYNANGDSGRFAEVLALFADDAVMELESAGGEVRTFAGRDAIATIFTSTRQQWADAAAPPDGPAAPHYVRHSTTTHQIDLVDERHARGRCYYSVVMGHGLDHWGRYLDEYECRDGRWLFTRRRAVSDRRTDRSAVAG